VLNLQDVRWRHIGLHVSLAPIAANVGAHCSVPRPDHGSPRRIVLERVDLPQVKSEVHDGGPADSAQLVDDRTFSTPGAIDRLTTIYAEQVIAAAPPVTRMNECEAQPILSASSKSAVSPDLGKVVSNCLQFICGKSVRVAREEFRAMRVAATAKYS